MGTSMLLLFSHILFCNALYAPLREYAGQSFFTGWNFPGHYDNTTSGACPRPSRVESPNVLNVGSVIFVDHATATVDRLAHVNDAGHAILRVDNSTDITVTGTDRNSVGP